MASVTDNLKLFITAISDHISETLTGYNKNFETLNKLYHVGVVIQTFNPSWDPNVEFPGTSWVLIEGRFLVGASKPGSLEAKFSVGSPGGAMTHQHLTANGFDGKRFYGMLGSGYTENNGIPYFGSTTEDSRDTLIATGSYERGSGVRLAYTDTQSNLPPYEPCYIWKRVG